MAEEVFTQTEQGPPKAATTVADRSRNGGGSDAAECALGRSRVEAVGRVLTDIVPTENRQVAERDSGLDGEPALAIESLRAREVHLTQAQRVAKVGSWQWEIDRDEISWSDELYRLFGVAPGGSHPTYESFRRLVHPDDRADVDDAVRRALEERLRFELEHRIVRPDESVRTVHCHGEVVIDERGSRRMVGTCQDVTERVRAEDREAFGRELAVVIAEANGLPQAIELTLRRICERTGWVLGQAWIPAGDGSYLECSPSWYATSEHLKPFRARSASLTLRREEGLPGRAWAAARSIWVPDVRSDPGFVRRACAREVGLGGALAVPVLTGAQVVAVLEFFVQAPRVEDEQLLELVSVAAAQLGALVRRKQSEEVLRRGEERFRLLVDNLRDHAIVMLDRTGHVESWNQGAERITGYRAESIVGYHISRFYTAEAVDRGEPDNHLGLAASGDCYEQFGWRVRNDGLLFWANVVITALLDDGGELRGFSYVMQDVSERKRADDELRKLSAIVDQSDDAIFSTSPERFVVTSWNPEAERLFGYSAREMIGRPVSVLSSPGDADAHEDIRRTVLESGRVARQDVQALRKNGGTVEVSLTVSPIRDTEGRLVGLSSIARDVTEKRRAHLFLEEAFRTYLDRDVAQHILDEGPSLPGEEVEVTMMFVDVRDFTAFTAQCPPTEVVATLNRLFDLVVPIITSRGGHVDKFVGDGLLAVFGAPRRLADHADRALDAALDIERVVGEQLHGRIEIGIGIDSGTVVAGNVGGGGRLDFTVIGDAVNTAARIEAATRDTEDTVLVSEPTKTRLRGVKAPLAERPAVAIKGKARTVRLYAPQR